MTEFSQIGDTATAILTVAPAETLSGTFDAAVEVSDGRGGIDHENFTIEVLVQDSIGPGPELPSYSVSGTVFKSTTHQPLSGAEVFIDDQQTITDTLGHYSISNVLGGEAHTLIVSKSGFETYTAGFQMGFADLDSFDIVLGKLLYFTDQIRGPDLEPNGIVWAEDITWASCGFARKITILDDSRGFEEVKYLDSPGSFPAKDIYTTPYGMTTTEEGGTQYLWISVALDDGSNFVYKMSIEADTTLSTESRYDTPESTFDPDVTVILDDLTFSGTQIWSCSSDEGKIYKHGSNMSVAESYSLLGENPAGIACDGNQLWVSTHHSNKLYLLNAENFEQIGHYVLLEAPVVGLLYRDGHLWACKHGSQSWPSFYYKYCIE